MAEAPADVQQWLEPLVRWAEQLEQRDLIALATFRGKNNITTLLPRLRRDGAGLVTLVLGQKGAYLQLWRSVFTRRAPEGIAVVERLLGVELKNGARTTELPDGLLAELTGAYEDATRADARR